MQRHPSSINTTAFKVSSPGVEAFQTYASNGKIRKQHLENATSMLSNIFKQNCKPHERHLSERSSLADVIFHFGPFMKQRQCWRHHTLLGLGHTLMSWVSMSFYQLPVPIDWFYHYGPVGRPKHQCLFSCITIYSTLRATGWLNTPRLCQPSYIENIEPDKFFCRFAAKCSSQRCKDK